MVILRLSSSHAVVLIRTPQLVEQFSLLDPQFKYIKFHIFHFHNTALLNANQYSSTFTKVFILYTYLFSLTLFINVKLGVFTRNYTCQLEKKIVITIEISCSVEKLRSKDKIKKTNWNSAFLTKLKSY